MRVTHTFLPTILGLLFLAFGIKAQAAPKAVSAAKSSSPSFIENKGQIVDQYQEPRVDVDVKLQAGKGLNIFVSNNGLSYQFCQLEADASTGSLLLPGRRAIASNEEAAAIEMYRMEVVLLGANLEATLVKEEQQLYSERYYLPSVSTAGAVAHSFKKVSYKNIYPNIDWVLYVTQAASGQEQLKYDFVVHPGGKVSDIRIQYKGATATSLLSDGGIKAATPMGEITEAAPVSYTQAGTAVASRFVLEQDVLSFDVAPYQGTLVIDPELEWGTYFGGLGNDQPSGIVADESGNVYMSGGTLSLDNIATTGAYQTSYGGDGGAPVMGDAYLAKFSSSGQCIWATYYGGSGEDRGLDVAFNEANGAVYLAGYTRSASGISTPGSHQPTHAGNFDAFLVKFDTSGEREWGTYYGGVANEGSSYSSIGLACDTLGNVFLLGETKSTDNIASINAFQTNLLGSSDAFVVKFDNQGVRQWGSYFGGDGAEIPSKVSNDASGNLYITGTTTSTSGLATTGSYQPTHSGSYDGFIARINETGQLQWASYFGGPGFDDIQAIAADGEGYIYLVGATQSSTGIASTNGFQNVMGSTVDDGFLAKFDTDGYLQWSTYYGGEQWDGVADVAVRYGSVFITGYTTSTTGIATEGSYAEDLNNQSYDGFIARFDTSGQREWGTYFGGTETELGISLSLDNNYNLYLAGSTNSPTLIATSGTHQEYFAGGAQDVFLIKFDICTAPQQPETISGNNILCSGQEYIYAVDSVPGAVSYTWLLPQGWVGDSEADSIQIIPDQQSGTLSVIAHNSCASSDTTSLEIMVEPSPEPEIVQNENTLSTTESYSSYQWLLNEDLISGATAATYTLNVEGVYTVQVTNEAGCTGVSGPLSTGPVAVEEIDGIAASIKVYPNPATGVIYIEAPMEVKATISSLDGRVWIRQTEAKSIDLSSLASANYWVRIFDSNDRLLKVVPITRLQP